MPPTPDPVPVSPERFARVSADVRLCYQTFGDECDPAMLLVMGLSGPMTWWDSDLCRRLACAGFFVVRYDNRDTGRSSHLPGRVTRRHLVGGYLGRDVPTPYVLADLADDAAGLLDHLGLRSAHLVGMSMGGMIAQTLAVERPERVRSLTSIMSSVGRRSVGWQSPRIVPLILAPRGRGRAAYAARSTRLWRLIGSPSFPEEPARIRQRAEETFDRGYDFAGVMRQMLAVARQPDRTLDLGRITVPTLVVHGVSDRMVHVSGGRATAAAIPGAELMLVPGMGHNLPAPLFPALVAAIARTAHRADTGRRAG